MYFIPCFFIGTTILFGLGGGGAGLLIESILFEVGGGGGACRNLVGRGGGIGVS